jgi:hypothetical protein
MSFDRFRPCRCSSKDIIADVELKPFDRDHETAIASLDPRVMHRMFRDDESRISRDHAPANCITLKAIASSFLHTARSAADRIDCSVPHTPHAQAGLHRPAWPDQPR